MTFELIVFLTGAITFLFVFGWFKSAATIVFKSEFAKNSLTVDETWKKLFKVFLVDLLICITGVIATGTLFLIILRHLPI
jgi:hypothetical protein